MGKDIIKKYKGHKYNHTFMLEKVKLHPELKQKLQDAKDELNSAEQQHIQAKEDFEDVELEWHNHISEWEGFKPFEDELKRSSQE